MVFVAGAPNSGTSLLRTLLAQPGLALGQDSCVDTTRCIHMNIEGQWLLKRCRNGAGVLTRAPLENVYKPGDLNNHLTPRNVSGGGDEARVTLWRSWARYWDMTREAFVEKSPANLVKITWLDAIFRPAKRLRFVVVVKSPLTHSSFTADRAAKQASKDCRVSFRARKWGKQDRRLLRSEDHTCDTKAMTSATIWAAEVQALEQWAQLHEDLASDLEGWTESKEKVGVINYERLAETCPCEGILRFALPASLLENRSLVARPASASGFRGRERSRRRTRPPQVEKSCLPFRGCGERRRLNIHMAGKEKNELVVSKDWSGWSPFFSERPVASVVRSPTDVRRS